MIVMIVAMAVTVAKQQSAYYVTPRPTMAMSVAVPNWTSVRLKQANYGLNANSQRYHSQIKR